MRCGNDSQQYRSASHDNCGDTRLRRRAGAARKAKQALEAANVRVLGTVLNNRTFPIPEKIYRML